MKDLKYMETKRVYIIVTYVAEVPEETDLYSIQDAAEDCVNDDLNGLQFMRLYAVDGEPLFQADKVHAGTGYSLAIDAE